MISSRDSTCFKEWLHVDHGGELLFEDKAQELHMTYVIPIWCVQIYENIRSYLNDVDRYICIFIYTYTIYIYIYIYMYMIYSCSFICNISFFFKWNIWRLIAWSLAGLNPDMVNLRRWSELQHVTCQVAPPVQQGSPVRLSTVQLIGLREKIQDNSIFHGTIYGFL